MYESLRKAYDRTRGRRRRYGAGMAQARVWRGRRYGALGHKANSRARHLVFRHRSKIPNSLKNLTRNRV